MIPRRFAATLMCVLVVVSCGDTAARSSVAPTTSIVDRATASTSIVETATPLTTLPASSSTDLTESAEQRCTTLRPERPAPIPEGSDRHDQ